MFYSKNLIPSEFNTIRRHSAGNAMLRAKGPPSHAARKSEAALRCQLGKSPGKVSDQGKVPGNTEGRQNIYWGDFATRPRNGTKPDCGSTSVLDPLMKGHHSQTYHFEDFIFTSGILQFVTGPSARANHTGLNLASPLLPVLDTKK